MSLTLRLATLEITKLDTPGHAAVHQVLLACTGQYCSYCSLNLYMSLTLRLATLEITKLDTPGHAAVHQVLLHVQDGTVHTVP